MKQDKKHTFIIIIICLIFSSCPYAQYSLTNESLRVNLSRLDKLDSATQSDSITDKREFYLSFNSGFLEVIGLGFGFQHSNEWSFTTKVSLASKRQDAYSVSGIGIRAARFFSTSLPFNNINIQPTVIMLIRKVHSYDFGLNGFSFEIGIGNESIKINRLDFFWSLGGTITTIKKEKPLYTPSLKLGLNWNF